MARGKETSTELCAIIVALSKAGFPNFKIASILRPRLVRLGIGIGIIAPNTYWIFPVSGEQPN